MEYFNQKVLIEKEAVFKVIEETNWYHINKDGKLASGANSAEDIPLYKSDDIYKAVDSVEPVDAIPIKWIMEWAARYPEFVSKTIFMWMIEDWRKEQKETE